MFLKGKILFSIFLRQGDAIISEKFIKIPSWIFQPDEDYLKEFNLHRLPVFCHLYRNTTILHTTRFSAEEYCKQNQKNTAAEKRNAIQQANGIIEFLEKHGYLKKICKYHSGVEYDMSYQNLIQWTPFVLLTMDEYKKITYNPFPEAKNKGALLMVLCLLKNSVNRSNKDLPKGVCAYKTSTLVRKSGLSKETYLKYFHQLENMDLIKHKIIHIPSKNKNR